MFSLMLQKLLHKKWMVICLLIGYVLLIAVAVSHPMYRTSSFQRMLTDEFRAYEELNQVWPATFSVTYRKAGKTAPVSVENIEGFIGRCDENFGIPLKYSIRFYALNEVKITPVVERDESVGRAIKPSMMTGLEDHIELVSGRMPKEGVVDDNVIEVIVSQNAEKTQDLLLDEEFIAERFYDLNENQFKIRVVGIFKKIDEKDPFWQDSMKTLNKEAFVSEATFRSVFLGDADKQKQYGYAMYLYSVWDYEGIHPQDVRHINYASLEAYNDARYGKIVQSSRYQTVLDTYSAKAKKVEASLLILQVPALLLLCAFLYMISGQMLSMEQNEISLMKSRGAKRRQIIGLYTMQSLFLGLISLVIALPLGRLLCQVLGSSTNFLEFSTLRTLDVQYSFDIIYYALGAWLAGVVMTVFPVISYSKVGIVNLKQGKHRSKKSFWKVAFIDFICLGIALYGYYNFTRNRAAIMTDVLKGESLDPMIYFASSLFILGAGLLLLRIQPLLIKLIFVIGKKNLRPAPYASFLETIRSGKKQEFIMLFMIMTVSLGIYNATVARTIVSNAEANATYIAGSDIVLKEKWSDNSYVVQMEPSTEFKYYEPDYNKYGTIEGVEEVTKVLRMNPKVNSGKISVSASVLGIIPQEFAKITSLDSDLNNYDMYDYLNVLASVENGAILSENFMVKKGLKIGDLVSFSDTHFGKVMLKVVGFFSYWPTYEPTEYTINKDGGITTEDHYMLIANLPYLQKTWGVTPYEVWMKVTDTQPLYDFVDSNTKLKFSKFNDLELTREEIQTDTLFQGTNGILTMSFIIVLVLCAVGYLIYWIMSIRSRELLFGVLRAMGMRKREITGMLIVEQICCGLYSIVSGAGVGYLASRLFVPLVQSAYAADNQVLPLTMITSQDDMVKLFAVIFAVMIVCLIVIGRIVSKMNISNALKLGED